MRSFAVSTALASAAIGLVSAQTPAGFQPATSNPLNVRYGSTSVVPDVLLAESVVGTIPTISLNQTVGGTLMALLVDLSIPAKAIVTTGPAAVGLIACRTTRLHYLQTDLTQASNGTLVSSTPAIAPYAGPMPGLNDIPHTYTFFIFNQPAGFSLPAWDAGRNYTSPATEDRMNFSVPAIASVAGNPIAGTYIHVQNPNNNATGTATNGTCLNTITGAGAGNATATNSTSSAAAASTSASASASGAASVSATSASAAASKTASTSSSASAAASNLAGKVQTGVTAAMALAGVAAFAML